MDEQAQAGTKSAPGRRSGGCLRWLGTGLASILTLILAGTIYERIAEAADAKAYPPPGQMVDVGGHRLHIHCTGAGSPTVVIDAGLGDWTTSWGTIQTEVAKATRVCTYDRAGLGWSDPGPLPRDSAQFVSELHTLLQNANVPGPYILVGHSLGGLNVRVFAHKYPAEVAGLVLVDSMNPNQVRLSPSEPGSRTEPPSEVFSLQAALARFGLVRVFVKLTGLASSLPPDQEAYIPRYIRPDSLQTITNEYAGVPGSAAQAAEVKTLGDLPVIVLTAGLNQSKGWPDLQTELLQLSSDSRQIIAENSGHNMQADAPEVIIEAILQMVGQLREAGAGVLEIH